MPYGPHTDGDRERMLASLGVASIDELFADIPEALRASGIDLPRAGDLFEKAARTMLADLGEWRLAHHQRELQLP